MVELNVDGDRTYDLLKEIDDISVMLKWLAMNKDHCIDYNVDGGDIKLMMDCDLNLYFPIYRFSDTDKKYYLCGNDMSWEALRKVAENLDPELLTRMRIEVSASSAIREDALRRINNHEEYKIY